MNGARNHFTDYIPQKVSEWLAFRTARRMSGVRVLVRPTSKVIENYFL